MNKQERPGVEAAKQAAAACYVYVVSPPEISGVSGFNDYARHLNPRAFCFIRTGELDASS